MEEWTGFTDEELKRLKHQTSNQQGSGSRGGRRGGGSGRQGVRGRTPPTQKQHGQQNNTQQHTISKEAMLAPPKPKPPAQTQRNTEIAQKQNVEITDNVQNVGKAKSEEKESKEKEVKETEVKKKEVKEINEKEALQIQLSQVEQYRLQQKMMEDQNKIKKELLSTAIVERQKRAKAEAYKLIQIQQELSVLDQRLSVDVNIIRDRIEESSREYVDAQHRYERAEKEFIEAKIDLNRKSELKEELTEHLYTIIHQNELRKAKKLTELMEKLEMEGDQDVEEAKLELTSLPHMMSQTSVLNNLMHPTSPTRPPDIGGDPLAAGTKLTDTIQNGLKSQESDKTVQSDSDKKIPAENSEASSSDGKEDRTTIVNQPNLSPNLAQLKDQNENDTMPEQKSESSLKNQENIGNAEKQTGS